MRRILIIGIGAGNPDYLTVQAIKALNQADVIFIPDKGSEKADLRTLRTEICDRFIEDKTYRTVDFRTPRRAEAGADYRASVDDWHAAMAAAYERLLVEELSENECGAFLVWGDPTLYDSTLRIIEALRSKGLSLDYQVVPGITAMQALAAQHRIALNRIGEPVLITTGRKIAAGFPSDLGDVVVMLDGDTAFMRLDPADLAIYWGAYVGTEHEILVSGKLSEVMHDIQRIRTNARAEHGWIMDTYLLRKAEKP